MPTTIAKQLVLLLALETGIVTVHQVTGIIQSILGNFSSRTRMIRQLRHEQQKTVTQDDWMDVAERIDRIQGNDVWRSDPNCPLYERDRICARIDEYVHLMRRQDIFELMFVLRYVQSPKLERISKYRSLTWLLSFSTALQWEYWSQ